MEPGDAAPERAGASPAAADAPASAQAAPDACRTDERSARRAALRDLAAMIGAEVFY